MGRSLVCSVFTLATSAAAQDGTDTVTNRSPINAQKFIAAAPPSGFWTARGTYMREGAIEPAEACVTRFNGKPGTLSDTIWTRRDGTRVVKRGVIGVLVDTRLVVTKVFEGDPASRVGVRLGDEIKNVDDHAITNVNELNVYLSERLRNGGPAKIIFERRGKDIQSLVDVVQAGTGPEFHIPDPDPAAEMLTIDWSTVEQVDAVAGRGNNSFWIEIHTPSDAETPVKQLAYAIQATRDRALSAAQYLKTACDRSKELGF